MIFPAYFILYYHIFPQDVLQEDRENFSQVSSCDGREGGAQRLVVRVNSIKRTGMVPVVRQIYPGYSYQMLYLIKLGSPSADCRVSASSLTLHTNHLSHKKIYF